MSVLVLSVFNAVVEKDLVAFMMESYTTVKGTKGYQMDAVMYSFMFRLLFSFVGRILDAIWTQSTVYNSRDSRIQDRSAMQIYQVSFV